jgi:hypothetical protein
VASVCKYRTLNINGASTTLQPFAIVNGTLTIGDSGGQPIKVENTRPPLPRQPLYHKLDQLAASHKPCAPHGIEVDLSSIAPNAKRETGLEPAASTLGR